MEMRDRQFADERKCRYIFTTVGNLNELVLKVTDVGLEVVTQPHFDGEEVVVILLGLPVEDVLGEKRLGYLLETIERTRWQGVKLIRGHAFQAGRKC